jgi:hypothetical protein
MKWVAIALLVNYLTGSGDDTRAFRSLMKTLSQAVVQVVNDPARQDAALVEINTFRHAFGQFRDQLSEVGACIERVDRTYEVTVEDYRACDPDRARRWNDIAASFKRFKLELRNALTDDEWKALDTLMQRKARRL